MNDSTKDSPARDPRRRRSGRALVAAAAGVLLAATVFAVHQYRSRNAGEGEYLYAAVATGDIEDLVTATGTLQPRDYVDVGAQVSGQIDKLYVDVGDVVKAGDVLVTIDPEASQARVDANRASLRSSQTSLETQQSNLEKAERDYQREQNLIKDDATTQESVANAKTAWINAQNQIKQSQAQIDQQVANMRIEETNLKYTRIVAPIAGTVMSIAIKEGQTVNATQNVPNVLRIANLGTMTVQSDVSEADVSKLYTGVRVYFTTLGGGTRRWYSTLKRIEPTPKVQNSVVLYNALFDIDNEGGTLMPSMTAQVFFVNAEAREVLTVPMAALQQGQQITRELKAKQQQQQGAKPAAPGATPVAASAGQVEQFRNRMREQGVDAGPPGAAGKVQRRNGTVMVKKADGTLEARPVVIGVTNRVMGQVLDGLKEGEQVVIGKREKEAAAAPATTNQNQQNQNRNPLGGGGFPGGGAGGGRPF